MSYKPQNFTVWAEIPVTDMKRAMAFYSAATGADLTLDESGPNPMAVFQTDNPELGVAGHLYPGKPANDGQGPTVHLAASGSIEAIMERVKDAGGAVVSEPIAIPAGRFVYVRDPDGNSIGFFEGKTG
jgi:predicted enzyme related to lactoylglutathione lyase